jgi:tail tube protein
MGEVALRKIQAALEVTRGVDLAATRKVYATGTMAKKIDLLRPLEDRGTFTRNYRSTLGVIEASFPMQGGLTYEDLPWWSQLAIKGGVTSSLVDTTARRWAFVPSQTTDDLASATFEAGDDTQAFQMNYGMVDKFEITGAINSYWAFTVDVIGTDMSKTTFTGALGDRTVEDINMYLTKCAIGAAGAVPSSYMTGRFIGFKFNLDNHLSRKYFADGVAPTLGGIGREKREITLEVTMEGNAATITERDTYEAGTPRVVRITALGSLIAGSSPSHFRTADLIVPGKWRSFDMGNRETNTVFTAILDSEYDTALAYDMSLTIDNLLTTLP